MPKKCPTCNNMKALNHFGNNRTSKDGKAAYCKDCVRSKNSKGGRIKNTAVCMRCDFLWKPRKRRKDIIICPRCKSPYWDTPKKRR